MTSRELQAKLAAALRIIDTVERMFETDDPVDRLCEEDMAKLRIADFRELFPTDGTA